MLWIVALFAWPCAGLDELYEWLSPGLAPPGLKELPYESLSLRLELEPYESLSPGLEEPYESLPPGLEKPCGSLLLRVEEPYESLPAGLEEPYESFCLRLEKP